MDYGKAYRHMTRRLILASASPRRKELLDRLGVPFEVIPADIDESVVENDAWVEAIPRQLAARKARAVAAKHPDAVVLAADTIVVLGRRVLNKPESSGEARRMLRILRNRWHDVITGVAVASHGSVQTTHTLTRVRMRAYSSLEIDASIARGEPFDKAGAYAIQDERFQPVDTFEGCYCNVVGLPLGDTLRMLRAAGICVENVEFPAHCAACPLFNEPPS
jgi:septum formation protein